ncbi:MAG: 2Fe-2S iron-sulfur cluster binding domain-containing protein [Candidatus Aureabacteria bacterium]|nr:2Fe-2S iron-sulfur cluster binding domain-containing protein [Candidatus Auribacterota bacterium]
MQSDKSQLYLKVLGKKIPFKKGESFRDVLQKNGIEIMYPCGGAGLCGRCGIKVLSGSIEPTSKDRDKFDEKDVLSGWRLACGSVLTENTEVFVPPGNLLSEEEIKISKTRDGKDGFLNGSKQKGKRFVAGVVIITISVFLGQPFFIAALACFAAKKYFIGVVCFVIYGISWILLLSGIYLAGKEGYVFVKKRFKSFFKFKKKRVQLNK